MCSNSEYFRKMTSDGFYTISTRPARSSPNRLNHLRAFGTLCALHIAFLGCGPDPVVPFLIKWAFGGLQSIMGMDLVESLAPRTAVTLQRFPDVPLALGSTITADLVAFAADPLNMEVSHLYIP
jgi:hypothetical protein